MKENPIAKKIIDDAARTADTTVKDARIKAADKLREARKQFEREEVSAKETAAKKHAEMLGRQKSMREGEARKSVLAEKQAIMLEVSELAKKDLLGNKARFDELMTALAHKNKKANDTVKKIDGGIIIINPNYELKITLDELLADLRAQYSAEIAKILWGS